MSPVRAAIPLFLLAALVAAPSAGALHLYLGGVHAVGHLTHRVYVDGDLACEDTGDFYGSSAQISPFEPLYHGGAFIGVTSCGEINDKFRYRQADNHFPHYVWNGAPDRWLAHTVLELSLAEAPMIYERTMPDGSFVKVEGPALGVYVPV